MPRTIILIISLLISLLPHSILAANDTVSKTVCKLAVGYENVDDIKADLLIEAKREVVNELFGELIVASTAVENFVVTSDQIRASSIGFVRVDGNAEFYNGDNFVEACVTIRAYVTAEDQDKFEPVKLSKKLCDSNDDLTTTQLISFVKDEAIVQALIEFNPKLKGADRESLLQLVQKVTYRGNGFITDTQTYCATFDGYVVPVEIAAFVETAPPLEAETSPKIEGLVAYYSFDDEAAKDESGNHNDGIIYGDPASVNGVKGKAFKFDGVDDYIEVANSTTLNPSNLSIAAWINLVDLPPSAEYIIVNKEDQYEIGIVPTPVHSAQRHELAMAFNPYWWWYGTTYFPKTNQNIHVVVIFDQSKTATTYVNGVKTNVIPYSQGITNTDNCLRIAARGCANNVQFKPSAFFKGMIDEVRIYDRPLSDSEIQSLYGMEGK